MVSDQLVYQDAETGVFHPALAESFDYIEPTTIEFKLRDGVKFHDGSPVTADDIVYSFEFVANPDNKVLRSNFVRQWFESVEKVDEHTIRVHSLEPYPFMLRDIELFVPTRKAGVYGEGDAKNLEALSQSFVGTGPYKITSFSMGRGITLERFEDYYADSPKGPGHIGKFVLRTLPEWGTVSAELISGGIQWSFDVPDSIAGDLSGMPMLKVESGPSTRIAFIVLDAKGVTDPDGPLTKVEVRQAINHAINRQEIVDYLVKGNSQVINAPCYPEMFGCPTDTTVYDYDPDKARALLADAGYPDGFEFELWAYRDRPITEAIIADLADVGIKVNTHFGNWSALSKARAAGEIEAMQLTWGNYATADVGAITNHFELDSDRNLTGNPKVSELFDAALKTVDQQERADLYHQAISIISDEAYVVPLYQVPQSYVMSTDVEFEVPADGLPRLHQMSWSE